MSVGFGNKGSYLFKKLNGSKLHLPHSVMGDLREAIDDKASLKSQVFRHKGRSSAVPDQPL